MFSVSRDVTFQSSCAKNAWYGKRSMPVFGTVKPPLCSAPSMKLANAFPEFPLLSAGADVSSRLNAKLPDALLRLFVFSISNWKL